MFTLGMTGLIACYVLVALLLLSINLYSNWSWKIKAFTIIVVSLFYLLSYYSFPPLLGWATRDDLPERFNLVGVYVEEPDKLTGAKGEIFLWVTDMEAGPGHNEPRAYRLPFTAELHAKVVEAGTKLRKNLPQLGELEEEGPGGRPLDRTQMGQESVNIEFYDLPDPLFPEK